MTGIAKNRKEADVRMSFDFSDEVDRIAGQVQRRMDQAVLDKVADQLENFGYVKVVRCRDCRYFHTDKLGDYCTLLDFEDVKGMKDCFCSWGARKEESS